MTLLMVILLAAAAIDGEATNRLIRCIETKDQACLIRELQQPGTDHSAEYLSAASEAYLLLGQNAAAITAIGSALEKKPGDYHLLLQQGRTQQRCGDQLQAIQSFLVAAKAKPPSSEVFYNLGLSFFLLHEFERAGKHFRHAVELDGNNDKAEFMLAVIDIMQSSNEASAQAHLERALALAPENPHYLLHYGVLLAQRNDRERAAAVLEKAVKADPSNPLAHFNLGRLRRQMNDLATARVELEIALRLRPELARAHYQLASVYRALGETKKSEEALQKFAKFKEQDRD